MKKRHLIIGAMVCCAVMGTPGTAMSQMSETATKEVYDFSGFVDVDLLNLFYEALQDGRKLSYGGRICNQRYPSFRYCIYSFTRS